MSRGPEEGFQMPRNYVILSRFLHLNQSGYCASTADKICVDKNIDTLL